jgi:hypothetical protein
MSLARGKNFIGVFPKEISSPASDGGEGREQFVAPGGISWATARLLTTVTSIARAIVAARILHPNVAIQRRARFWRVRCNGLLELSSLLLATMLGRDDK